MIEYIAMEDTNSEEKKFSTIFTRNKFYIKTVNKKDILDNLNLSDEDRFMTSEAISLIESTAANGIKHNKAVSLPYFGVLRKNPYKTLWRKNRYLLRHAKKCLDNTGFKQFCRDILDDIIDEVNTAEQNRKLYVNVKRKIKDKYIKYRDLFGVYYADMLVRAYLALDIVEFNQEWQDKYDELNGINRDKNTGIDKNQKFDLDKFNVNEYLMKTDDVEHRVDWNVIRDTKRKEVATRVNWNRVKRDRK